LNFDKLRNDSRRIVEIYESWLVVAVPGIGWSRILEF